MNIALPPKNLYHMVKRASIDNNELYKYFGTYPSTERRIGTLPYDWIREVKPEQRAELTQSVHKVLSDFAKKLWEQSVTVYESAKINWNEEQNALLKKLKQLLQREDIKIEYAGTGRLKYCSKITVGDYPYALSTFNGCSDFVAKRGHGTYYEPQNVFTIYKRCSQGRFAKPFMAQVSAQDEPGGYILSKFIDEKHPQKELLPRLLRSREYYYNWDELGANLQAEAQHNSIRGIGIEAGGRAKNKRYIPDPHTRYIWRNLVNKLFSETRLNFELNQSGVFIDINKMYEHLSNIKKQGIDLCEVDARKITNGLTEDEQKVAIKLIRVLKKARKEKNKLIEKGEFEKYQKLLAEDLRHQYPFNRYNEDLNIEPLMGYPKLVAEELGINNVPELKDFHLFVGHHAIDADKVAKYYTKEQVTKYIKEGLLAPDGKSYVSYNENFTMYLLKHYKLKDAEKAFQIRDRIDHLKICIDSRFSKISETQKEKSQIEIQNLEKQFHDLVSKL